MAGFVTLDHCAEPACPRCGCQDSQILQHPQPGKTWFPTGRARCRHCGRLFSFRSIESAQVVDPAPTELPPISVQQSGPLSTRVDVVQPSVAIVVDPTSCPDCGAVAKAYSTKGRTQYRKCPECGKKFKTMKDAG